MEQTIVGLSGMASGTTYLLSAGCAHFAKTSCSVVKKSRQGV